MSPAPENFRATAPLHSHAREVWDAKPCPFVNGEGTLFGSASYGNKPCSLSRLNPDQFIGAFERSRSPAVMATPQAGEASQEVMAKMNASMAAILRLAEMNR